MRNPAFEAERWTPILEGDAASEAVRALEGITADLERLRPADAAPRRMTDLALYFAYLARAREPRYDELADMWLEAAAGEAQRASAPPLALHNGLTGLAWTLEHVSRMRDGQEEDPNEGVDELLRGAASRTPWRGKYDLISGLVGRGVYFFERLPRPEARLAIEHVVERLIELGEAVPEGVRWHTPAHELPPWQQKLAPSGYYNLGIAHGVPGIIALLSRCVAHRIACPRAEQLLRGAMGWLLAQRQAQDVGSSFAPWVVPGEPPRRSRLAWCYGDPGVALAILSAALAIDDATWSRAAIAIAEHATRRSRDTTGVVDAGLCHGAAGLAHLYNRMFHATGDERLLSAARSWLQQTLAMRASRGFGGYQAYKPRMPDSPAAEAWCDDEGFLTGSSGIGLALLAAVSDVPPDWDRLLLTDLPSPDAA